MLIVFWSSLGIVYVLLCWDFRLLHVSYNFCPGYELCPHVCWLALSHLFPLLNAALAFLDFCKTIAEWQLLMSTSISV
jgi:hypothetical protein